MKFKVLPHCAIVISGMYFVFFFIDRVNQPMAFINNSITKALLLVLGVVSVVNAISLIRIDRRTERQNQARPRAAVRRATKSLSDRETPGYPPVRGEASRDNRGMNRAQRRDGSW